MALYGVLFMITFVQGIITSIQINNASPRE
jgi:hypothetical protein